MHDAAPERTLPYVIDVLETMSDAFFALDNAWTFTYLNGHAESLLERTKDELIGATFWDEFPEMVTPPLYEAFQRAAGANGEVELDQFYPPLYRWFQLRVRPMRGGLSVYFSDVTDKKLAERVRNQVNVALERRIRERTAQFEKVNEQLLHDTFHDTLTGLPNRRFFMDRLSQVMKRGIDSPFAILMFDIDRFKIVNDSLGHSAGDEMLAAVSATVRASLRPSDLAARLGGDEFVVLLESAASPGDALRVTEALRTRLLQPLVVGGRDVRVSVSGGIVRVTGQYERAEEALRDAEIAVRSAKLGGGASFVTFEHSMRERAMALIALEADLRRAVEDDEIEVHFQPIMEASTERLRGFEALARWQHPRHGFISPAEFVPLAEETGLVLELDRLVLRRACRQLRSWQDSVSGCESLQLSVNVSGAHFSRPEFAQELRAILTECGTNPGNLKVELTETVMTKASDEVQSNLEAIRALGASLHLDDFGTGYSSLGYLQRFPANGIKIDRSFTETIETREGQELIRTMIGMAHNLGMEVVAEGVETSRQYALLKELACDFVQGYLFGRPMPPSEAESLLRGSVAAARPPLVLP